MNDDPIITDALSCELCFAEISADEGETRLTCQYGHSFHDACVVAHLRRLPAYQLRCVHTLPCLVPGHCFSKDVRKQFCQRVRADTCEPVLDADEVAVAKRCLHMGVCQECLETCNTATETCTPTADGECVHDRCVVKAILRRKDAGLLPESTGANEQSIRVINKHEFRTTDLASLRNRIAQKLIFPSLNVTTEIQIRSLLKFKDCAACGKVIDDLTETSVWGYKKIILSPLIEPDPIPHGLTDPDAIFAAVVPHWRYEEQQRKRTERVDRSNNKLRSRTAAPAHEDTLFWHDKCFLEQAIQRKTDPQQLPHHEENALKQRMVLKTSRPPLPLDTLNQGIKMYGIVQCKVCAAEVKSGDTSLQVKTADGHHGAVHDYCWIHAESRIRLTSISCAEAVANTPVAVADVLTQVSASELLNLQNRVRANRVMVCSSGTTLAAGAGAPVQRKPFLSETGGTLLKAQAFTLFGMDGCEACFREIGTAETCVTTLKGFKFHCVCYLKALVELPSSQVSVQSIAGTGMQVIHVEDPWLQVSSEEATMLRHRVLDELCTPAVKANCVEVKAKQLLRIPVCGKCFGVVKESDEAVCGSATNADQDQTVLHAECFVNSFAIPDQSRLRKHLLANRPTVTLKGIIFQTSEISKIGRRVCNMPEEVEDADTSAPGSASDSSPSSPVDEVQGTECPAAPAATSTATCFQALLVRVCGQA
ncbi:unnamed protein product [Amoebophrya sp. A120]|nr:unnamed protein product [Amoebophrya sp. A120]|eukprot:GSA120T00001619001.1